MNKHITGNRVCRQQITDYDCVPYVAQVMCTSFAKEKVELTTGKRSVETSNHKTSKKQMTKLLSGCLTD